MYPSAIRSLALRAGAALTVVTLLGTFFGVYDPRNQLTPRQINATIRSSATMIFPCRDFVLGEIMATVVLVVYNIYGTNSQVTPDEYATIRTTYEQLVSNISDDRLQAVVLSLDIIKPDINDFGTKVFKILFKEYPEYQSQFPKLKDIPYDKLDANKSFTHHVNAVVLAIANSVVNLKNPNAVLPELEKLGTSHQRRNIRPEQFEVVTNIILKVLKEKVSDPQVLKTWQEILTILANTIISFMKPTIK
ncbi:hypothetical protein M8J76_000446 [Diaphorina citri]|nr:hypothetical protein M8J76_000446 [Diaphorina citri]